MMKSVEFLSLKKDFVLGFFLINLVKLFWNCFNFKFLMEMMLLYMWSIKSVSCEIKIAVTSVRDFKYFLIYFMFIMFKWFVGLFMSKIFVFKYIVCVSVSFMC